MPVRSAWSAVIVASVLVGLVSGCGDPAPTVTGGASPAPSSPPSSSATAAASSPPSSPSAAAPAPTATQLPESCAALVASADQSQFGSAPLNSPAFVSQGPSGVVTPTTIPNDANARQLMRAIHELWCLWADPSSDVTHLSVEVGHYDVASATGLMATLQSQGYACEDAQGGRLCSITQPNTNYPVDDNFTYFSRGDVMILVDQTNFPTNGLLASMVSVIWH